MAITVIETSDSADAQIMSLFQWSETYSVGHPAIDGQHKRLFQLAEQLHAAMAAGHGKQGLSDTLNNLIAYTKRHFADEERLMQAHHYPAYPQHRALHEALTQKVIEFQKSFESGRATVTMDLLHFLRDWLTHHIGAVDKRVGDYLKQGH